MSTEVTASTTATAPLGPDESTPIVGGPGVNASYNSTAAGQRKQDSRQENDAQPRQKTTTASGVQAARLPESSRRHDEQGQQKDSWLQRLVDGYGAIELENKGSTARDHLALERTFLAWLRTSLSFAGIGIAITQLFRLNTSLPQRSAPSSSSSSSSSAVVFPFRSEDQDLDNDFPLLSSAFLPSQLTMYEANTVGAATRLRAMGKPLGAAFLGVAILILLAGWRRYAEVQHFIIRGKFPASRGSVALATMAAAALVVSTFVIVLVVDPSLFTA